MALQLGSRIVGARVQGGVLRSALASLHNVPSAAFGIGAVPICPVSAKAAGAWAWRAQSVALMRGFGLAPLPNATACAVRRAAGQRAMSTGMVAFARMCRVAPPNIICRNLLWV